MVEEGRNVKAEGRRGGVVSEKERSGEGGGEECEGGGEQGRSGEGGGEDCEGGGEEGRSGEGGGEEW